MKSYIIILFLIMYHNVQGCDCFEKRIEGKLNFDIQYEETEMIGIGKITDIDKSVYPNKYLFKPRKIYKGTFFQTIELYSGLGGGDCGYVFELGVEYIIYANPFEKNKLFVSNCSRTSKVYESADYYLLENTEIKQEDYWSESIVNYIQYKTEKEIDLKNTYNIIYRKGEKISLQHLIKLHPHHTKIEIRKLGSGYLKKLNPPNREKARNGIIVVYGIGEEPPKTRKLIRKLNKK